MNKIKSNNKTIINKQDNKKLPIMIISKKNKIIIKKILTREIQSTFSLIPTIHYNRIQIIKQARIIKMNNALLTIKTRQKTTIIIIIWMMNFKINQIINKCIHLFLVYPI